MGYSFTIGEAVIKKDSKMERLEWLKAIEEREAKARKGPWAWYGSTCTKTVRLATIDRGRIFIMDFQRWGLQDAQPRFQNERGLMVKASDLVKYEVLGYQRVNDENRKNLYRKDFQGIDHPDAEFIAHSRTDIPTLLSALNKVYEALENIDGDLSRIISAVHETLPGLSAELMAVCDKAREALQYNPQGD